MELNERKLKILQAIIQDYIDTAEPVGSRTLSKKFNLNVSAATIRNEMADLEELGYLTQPHTSAGRVPSDRAYRLYVDNLMEIKRIADIQRHHIKQSLLKRFGEVEELLQYSSKVLSELTQYTSVVLASQIKENKLRHIQLVPVDSENVIAVIVTDTGIIKNPVLKVNGEVDYNILNSISNFLNENLQGLTIKDIESKLVNELKLELYEYSSIVQSITPKLFTVLESINDVELFLSGTTNIFNFPEFNDVFKAKNFLRMLEKKQLISSLIASSSNNGGLTISIGSENIPQEAKDCSLVTATYKIEGNTLGWLSVIGPTRMDYANVVSVMAQISKTLNEMLKTRFK
jgi:heat-inducible transcriptional repressor